MTTASSDYLGALQDFRRARRRANLQRLLASLAGQANPLLSYDDVRRKLRAVESPVRELTEIPLDAIVGSVGRYNDFTRGFLPRQDSDGSRWARVRMAMTGLEGVPPIEVYQLGDAFFVKDGNHRVSVARGLGSRYIQAYVTPVHSRVPLTPEVSPEELIIKAEYAGFLERTQLDRLRPGSDLEVTQTGAYQQLLEHIEVHRYYMGLEWQREVSYPEAVAHWYDAVYCPVVANLIDYGLLRDFEARTETDLYLWLAEHRARLEESYGWQLSTEAVAGSVSRQPPLDEEARERVLRRATGRASGGAAPDRLANDVLVPISGADAGWQALEQALRVAELEGSRLFGLHVLTAEEERQSETALAVRDRFLGRCAEADVDAQFAFAVGGVVPSILERTPLVDLMVASLVHPPGPGLAARLGSGYPQLLRRSPRPLLAVPGEISRLERPLLAYDGGDRAQQALFIAAYGAARWQVPLTVVTVTERGRSSRRVLDRARDYLDRYGLDATYVQARGPVAETLIGTAEAHGCDSILIGSHTINRRLETVFGGVLEPVLKQSGRPVLVV